MDDRRYLAVSIKHSSGTRFTLWGWFLFGLVISFGICGMADTKAVNNGRIQIKGKWYKLTRLD